MRRNNNQYTLGENNYSQYGNKGTLIKDYPTIRKRVLKTIITISALVIFLILCVAFLTKENFVVFTLDSGFVKLNRNSESVITTISEIDTVQIDEEGNIIVGLSILDYIILEQSVKDSIDNTINNFSNDEDLSIYIRDIEVNNTYKQAKIYLNDGGDNELSQLTYSLIGALINYELQICDKVCMRDSEVEVLIYDYNNSVIDTITEEDCMIHE